MLSEKSQPSPIMLYKSSLVLAYAATLAMLVRLLSVLPHGNTIAASLTESLEQIVATTSRRLVLTFTDPTVVHLAMTFPFRRMASLVIATLCLVGLT